jgi:hypothetical protein
MVNCQRLSYDHATISLSNGKCEIVPILLTAITFYDRRNFQRHLQRLRIMRINLIVLFYVRNMRFILKLAPLNVNKQIFSGSFVSFYES